VIRYLAKTGEAPEDREESVFFQHMKDNTPEFQAAATELAAYAYSLLR